MSSNILLKIPCHVTHSKCWPWLCLLCRPYPRFRGFYHIPWRWAWCSHPWGHSCATHKPHQALTFFSCAPSANDSFGRIHRKESNPICNPSNLFHRWCRKRPPHDKLHDKAPNDHPNTIQKFYLHISGRLAPNLPAKIQHQEGCIRLWTEGQTFWSARLSNESVAWNDSGPS